MTSRRYSHTALKIAQRCLRKWKYRYVDRLELAEDRPHLERGKRLHDGFEALYTGGELPEGLTLDDTEILLRYRDRYELEDAEWEIISAEEEYEMSVGLYTLVFKPDLVVRINGEVWIVDHKTTANIPDEYDPYNMTDFQHLLYIEGMRQQGYDVRGFMFNYVRTKPPTMPRLRKDGKIADIRRLDTDFRTLKAFAEEHGLDDDEDVRDKLRILALTKDRYFQRHFILANDEAVEQAVTDTATALDILMNAEHTEQYPRHVLSGGTGYAACGKCEFQGICHTEMLGMNVDLELLGLRERERRSS
jgi:hypothetical protein